uniref:Uncharacterized protein n=1 Tax=Leersia perrieri TaxID=77586 RepID=A0A0D9WXT8_9ORYZ
MAGNGTTLERRAPWSAPRGEGGTTGYVAGVPFVGGITSVASAWIYGGNMGSVRSSREEGSNYQIDRSDKQ